ncbi:protein serine/threonine kinase, putative, partial [Entamoeba invadens IP1]
QFVRIWTSNKIFCHVEECKSKIIKYIEHYCPCDNTEDWYITPLQNISTLFVNLSAYNTHSKTNHKTGDVFTTESVSFGSTQISLYKTDNIVIGISTPKVVDIKIFSLTKTFLLISETKLTYAGVQFNAVLNTENGFMKIKIVLRCTHKTYNKTSQTCEDPTICDDKYCKYCPINKNICMSCKSQFIVVNSVCKKITNCEFSKSNACFKCLIGYSLQGITCEYKEKCLLNQLDGKCQICNINIGYINNAGECVKSDINSNLIAENNDVSCNKGFVSNSTNCIKCDEKYTNPELCENGKITKCNSLSKMNANGKCEITDCVIPNDENGKCTTTIDNCKYLLNGKCNECENEFIFTNNTCQKNKEQNCILQNSFGCTRCNDTFYIDKSAHQCKKCDDSCLTCFETSTKCLSCPQNTYLSNYKCNTNHDLKIKCKQFATFGSGCIVCNEGYYRFGLDCVKCDSKCFTCNTKTTCLICNSTNYKTSSGDCLPQSDIIGCAVNVTQNGCSKCQDGYYTSNTNECQKCDENCFTCLLNNKCTSCISSLVLFGNGSCVGLLQISKCNEIVNSKCTNCAFWYSPNEDGTYCETHIVWWVIILVVILSIVILISFIVIIIIITKSVFEKFQQKTYEKTTTIFRMKRSNVHFISLQYGICVSSQIIDFNKDVEEIPVDSGSREVFCVGNTNKKVVKIQFTVSQNSDKFDLKIQPEVVCLKGGSACEFEIVLIPFCTCQIRNTIQIVSKCLKRDNEKYNTIEVTGVTQQTTRIDYDELNEENKIGEGSFGVVYKGCYRKYIVAIKKLKDIDDDEKGINEFGKEVAMLDKFRNNYIIHFYGAVFIPNKICLVTEFANYGSLQDLMKHIKSEEIEIKLRIKFMLDASKGILYLHTNGILHRDIKPDNILVFSIELNDGVNAKLTDFGSSRNVNMMMTNMTFTKGIGTPVYMAPEVLKQEKYKKPADVYSLSVTMCECFKWGDVYDKNIFKFPWKIAEFVNDGKRIEQPKQIKNELFDIITKCWCQNPNERLAIVDISLLLEKVNDLI